MSFPLSDDESSRMLRVPGTRYQCQVPSGALTCWEPSRFGVPGTPGTPTIFQGADLLLTVAMYQVPGYPRLSQISQVSSIGTRYHHPPSVYLQVPGIVIPVISLPELCTWYHPQSGYFNPSISENFASASGMSIN